MRIYSETEFGLSDDMANGASHTSPPAPLARRTRLVLVPAVV